MILGYPSKELSESLTEDALKIRLRSAESDFVERKPRNKKGDWLQAAVAFANSAPIGWPAVLFVGVGDDGTLQVRQEEDSRSLQLLLEDLSKSVSDVLESAYPPIYRHIVPLRFDNEGCLAVVVPGSPDRPHFAGKSYIRDGGETKESSSMAFDRLVSQRSELVRELPEGLTISFRGKYRQSIAHGVAAYAGEATVQECNRFYITFTWRHDGKTVVVSYPLGRIELSYDNLSNRPYVLAKHKDWD